MTDQEYIEFLREKIRDPEVPEYQKRLLRGGVLDEIIKDRKNLWDSKINTIVN